MGHRSYGKGSMSTRIVSTQMILDKIQEFPLIISVFIMNISCLWRRGWGLKFDKPYSDL